jgi:hypothetical protein
MGASISQDVKIVQIGECEGMRLFRPFSFEKSGWVTLLDI